MNLNYRVLDSDIFESYMALEGWDNFPLLKSYTENGEFGFLLKDNNYMIFDYKPSNDFLKAVCIYKMFGDYLIFDKRNRLDRAIDDIRNRFGKDAIFSACHCRRRTDLATDKCETVKMPGVMYH